MKIDTGKILGLLVTGLGVVATLLSGKAEDINRQTMKNELKKELLEELSNNNK